jgi:PAS domain S-box-containing protein
MHLSLTHSTQILDDMLEGCMVIGFDWTYLYINNSAARYGRYKREDLLGHSMLEKFPGVEKSKIFTYYKRCMDERIPQRFEEPFTFADGATVWNIYSIGPVKEGIFIFLLDITQQKKTEETLSVSESKWRSLFEILPVGVSISNSSREVLEFNSALCRILDLSKDELLNGKYLKRKYFKPDNTLMKPEDFPSYQAIQKNKTIRDEAFCIEKENGSRIWLNVNAVPFPYNDSAIAVTTDITERIISEVEIKRSKDQLAQLNNHLSEVREKERASIAREIHDELGQYLTCLKIDLIGIQDDLEAHPALKLNIDKAIALVNSSIKTVQKICSDLRPQMLDELGLAAAIEWLTHEFKKRTGIKCKLDLQEIEKLEENIAISLFRIFQASLANIMLHSKAKTISVKLTLTNGLLSLIVADDGIGIKQEQLDSPKSFGIIGMRERAKYINSRFTINSEIDKGTKITVTVPITGKKEKL